MRPVMPLLFRLLLGLAAVLAFAMMALTFSDVVMRYFFDNPIRGAFELTEIMMGLMVFTAAPAMTWAGENICVTLIAERLPVRLADILRRVMDLICGVVSGLAAWQLWRHGARLLRYREVTMELALPKGYVVWLMAVGMGLVAIAFLMAALRPNKPVTESRVEII